jgi:restriction endonuclease S subunit
MQYSIIDYRSLESISLRLDAEYYRPIFLDIEAKIKSRPWDYLVNLSESIKSFGAYSLCNQVKYLDKGIPFLRCKDIKNGLIDLSDVLFIDDDTNQLLWKSEVKPKTVLFTMSGTVGNSAIATEELKFPINSNQDIAKIVTNEKLNPYYFSIFLQSDYGKKQILRLPIGSVQQHIFLWQLERLIIPLYSNAFQILIERVFKLSLNSQTKALAAYFQVQTLLLSELGLLDWRPKHQLSFIKNYLDTQQAGRFDAEYFQPKYDEIVTAIKNYAGGWDIAENVLNIKDSNFSPKHNVEYKYIELANIGINGEITGFMQAEGQDLPSRARRKVSKDDVIVSSIEGSLSSCALIPDEYDGALCSTGFYIVDSNKINPQTLLVLLKSPIGQEQLKKGCSGTILTAINKDEIRKIVLPIVDSGIQNQIQQKIIESFNLRKQSKHLLECVKKAVEMAIEKDEETAMKWLDSQLNSIEMRN